MQEKMCGRLNNIECSAGSEFKLTFNKVGYVNIHNDTSGKVYIADSADASITESIFIESGGGYSGLYCTGVLYIRATAEGDVQIVVRG